MAKITLPYILQNHNNADGGQVQDDLNAILAQVNGNLDGNNIAPSGVSTPQVGDGAVTLPKLGSDVKVIEAIYHDLQYTNDGTINTLLCPKDTETTVFTQAITLSVARYMLINFSFNFGYTGDQNTDVSSRVYDGDTRLVAVRQEPYVSGATITGAFTFIKQLASGAHTIYFKVDNNNYADINLDDRAFTIIQFAF